MNPRRSINTVINKTKNNVINKTKNFPANRPFVVCLCAFDEFDR